MFLYKYAMDYRVMWGMWHMSNLLYSIHCICELKSWCTKPVKLFARRNKFLILLAANDYKFWFRNPFGAGLILIIPSHFGHEVSVDHACFYYNHIDFIRHMGSMKIQSSEQISSMHMDMHARKQKIIEKPPSRLHIWYMLSQLSGTCWLLIERCHGI